MLSGPISDDFNITPLAAGEEMIESFVMNPRKEQHSPWDGIRSHEVSGIEDGWLLLGNGKISLPRTSSFPFSFSPSLQYSGFQGALQSVDQALRKHVSVQPSHLFLGQDCCDDFCPATFLTPFFLFDCRCSCMRKIPPAIPGIEPYGFGSRAGVFLSDFCLCSVCFLPRVCVRACVWMGGC